MFSHHLTGATCTHVVCWKDDSSVFTISVELKKWLPILVLFYWAGRGHNYFDGQAFFCPNVLLYVILIIGLASSYVILVSVCGNMLPPFARTQILLLDSQVHHSHRSTVLAPLRVAPIFGTLLFADCWGFHLCRLLRASFMWLFGAVIIEAASVKNTTFSLTL